MNVDEKALLRKVINVFEVGTPETNYSSIYIYRDGPNRIRQITLGFGITEYGNLAKLLTTYIGKNGKLYANLEPYLSQVGKRPLVDDTDFKKLLVQAAITDPIMRESEDEIYDKLYWDRAEDWFKANQFTLNLSMAVILDSFIHSGSILPFLRKRFDEGVPAADGNEQIWIKQYLKTRRNWLATHSNPILRNTVYRADFFLDEIKKNNWSFNCPIIAHDVKIC